MKPNLFNFATSELSQDAFIAWLIAWADKKHKNSNEKLHELAKSFVKLLIQKDENFEIESIKVKKQWKKIDVSALVNDSIFIVIEDKTYSKAHSNQLERYHNIAKKHYNSDVDIKLIYYKMIEQGNYKQIDGQCF
ncbi:PD-(D/E)XK nuclease family protein [Flavobacterium sp. CS20]|uniref:PD-(D/E)XK nuclease family protein n=1 Tax=Flavobacterium sp. CS20 TaxID=2775246 RepID=UPI001B3A0A39|nr:PD-(D/E)XK nuclease family protein [Flavobacterium sp. CS20]QTY27060.1 PD-(D/E)XK nuclease family protein [Flavobacterium sp. CS20]